MPQLQRDFCVGVRMHKIHNAFPYAFLLVIPFAVFLRKPKGPQVKIDLH